MDNSQYVEKVFSYVERILIDTSTLMEPGFQEFIKNNKEYLLCTGKKIIVSKAVYTEIGRHLLSVETGKSNLAQAAIDLMVNNKILFQVESAPLSDEELAHAFADLQLLSELTIHRSEYPQLLITNDRDLSNDAYKLNQQLSCCGHKVLVCYVTWSGELQCCECALPKKKEKPTETERSSGSLPTCSSDSSSPTCAGTEEIKAAPWAFDWKSSLLGFSGAVLISVLNQGSKKLFYKLNT